MSRSSGKVCGGGGGGDGGGSLQGHGGGCHMTTVCDCLFNHHTLRADINKESYIYVTKTTSPVIKLGSECSLCIKTNHTCISHTLFLDAIASQEMEYVKVTH